ncbi:unnamed protein product [Brassicogethes aeneus]|uniref:Uncharacterized protein n=1 Tax=Brassicogethes aeneus TaxID=1431903 RepID=A0A9P0BCV6_BRAAE|nr:unnamed protein product [Brassicogethes aeneus]
MMGECDNVPELLTCFLESLIWGYMSHISKKKRESRKNKNELYIFSIGKDLIYAASGHKIKTSKHITLGLTVKSLCNSKKVVNILSKYGHCCSYTTLEELETELTFSTVNSGYVCPEDILRRPDLNTGVAFDNLDRFVETMNGKDTLDDTVGLFTRISYKIRIWCLESCRPCVHENSITDEIARGSFPELSVTTRKTKSRKRRAFEEVNYEIHPFTKKLKITNWSQLK